MTRLDQVNEEGIYFPISIYKQVCKAQNLLEILMVQCSLYDVVIEMLSFSPKRGRISNIKNRRVDAGSNLKLTNKLSFEV